MRTTDFIPLISNANDVGHPCGLPGRDKAGRSLRQAGSARKKEDPSSP
jgi:hypothetical protein